MTRRLVPAIALAAIALFAARPARSDVIMDPSSGMSQTAFPMNSTVTQLFTVRNHGPDPVNIDKGTLSGVNCPGGSVTVSPINFLQVDGRATTFPFYLAPSEVQQIQVEVTSLPFTVTCTQVLDVVDAFTGNPGTPPTLSFSFEFDAGTPTQTFDVQPQEQLEFGERVVADPVAETIRTTNLSGSSTHYQVTSNDDDVTLTTTASGWICDTMETCSGDIDNGAFADVLATCRATASSSGASLVVMDDNIHPPVDVAIDCLLATPNLSLVTPLPDPGRPATTP